VRIKGRQLIDLPAEKEPDWDPTDADDDHDDAMASASSRGKASDKLMMDMFKVPKGDGLRGWKYSAAAATKEVAQVLAWREEVMSHEDRQLIVLPFDKQKVVQQRVFDSWKNDPANKAQVEAIIKRGGNNDRVARDLVSVHRTYCAVRFGGREWMYLLIAVGKFDHALLDAVNEAQARRAAEAHRKKGPLWVEDEDILWARQVRALAAAQGKLEEPQGINHKTSEAKALREKAKWLQKKKDRADIEWAQGQCQMSARKYRQLEWELEQAWQEATEASEFAGVPYIGRDGQRKLERQEDTSFVGVVLRLYADKVGRSRSSKG
jgi:hypothetical protein